MNKIAKLLCSVSQYTATTTTKTTTTTSSSPTVTTIMTSTATTTSTAAAAATSSISTGALGYSNGILYLERDATQISTTKKPLSQDYNNNSKGRNHNNSNNTKTDELLVVDIIDDDSVADDVIDNDDDAADNDDCDSYSSMETQSDNVSIWVEGEKHWISGVDANTTCRDLICALLNYQQLPSSDEEDDDDDEVTNEQHNIADNAIHVDNVLRPQLYNISHNKNNSGNANIERNHRHKHKNKNNSNSNSISNKSKGNHTINQSIANTKEVKATDKVELKDVEEIEDGEEKKTEEFSNKLLHTKNNTLAGINFARPHMLLCDYVIVKQYRHFEEYLDGSTKVLDILPAKELPARKECELLLRYLASPAATTVMATTTTPQQIITQVSSLLSTDKDSGMGSPVGSSRSAKFRRKKYKSSTTNWLAQGNTLHPKLSQRNDTDNVKTNMPPPRMGNKEALAGSCISNTTANERLMKIILAQDETIQHQLALLREKERQISKIEEEKHRVRERELGKNYLLETYLNGLDETEMEQQHQKQQQQQQVHQLQVQDDLLLEDGIEIFIDEPYNRMPLTAKSKEIKTHRCTEETHYQQKQHRHKKQLEQQQQQQQQHHHHTRQTEKDAINEIPANKYNNKQCLSAITCNNDINIDDALNETTSKEIELQIHWLEKIYAFNKKLQREEEILVKLNAKIRKHQVKRAYQSKKEVLQQIDKLDNELTLQCHDIRKVEDKLLLANEQLQQKLGMLEKLNDALLEEVSSVTTSDVDENDKIYVANEVEVEHEKVTTIIADDAEQCDSVVVAQYDLTTKSTRAEIHREKEQIIEQQDHSMPNQHSKSVAKQVEHVAGAEALYTELDKRKLLNQDKQMLLNTTATTAITTVVSTSITLTPTTTTATIGTAPKTTATTLITSSIAAPSLLTASTMTTLLLQEQSEQYNFSAAAASQLSSHSHLQQQHQQHQQSNYPISRINHSQSIEALQTTSSDANIYNTNAIQQLYEQQQKQEQLHINNKNMLPLHANNVKTVKKQMFDKHSLNHVTITSSSSASASVSSYATTTTTSTAMTTTTTTTTTTATQQSTKHSYINNNYNDNQHNLRSSYECGLLPPPQSATSSPATILTTSTPPTLALVNHHFDITQLGTLV